MSENQTEYEVAGFADASRRLDHILARRQFAGAAMQALMQQPGWLPTAERMASTVRLAWQMAQDMAQSMRAIENSEASSLRMRRECEATIPCDPPILASSLRMRRECSS